MKFWLKKKALALLAFAIACNGSSAVFITGPCQTQTATTASSTTNTATSTTTTTTTTASRSNQLYEAQFGYPYDLTDSRFQLSSGKKCAAGQTATPLDRYEICSSTHNIVSSAQFFVFVGVMSFLYAIAFTIIYIFFRHKYNNIVYFPLIVNIHFN